MAITHVPASEGMTTSILGEVTTLKVRHPAYTMFESSTGPGDGLPPHAHADQDEAIYVLDGEYRLSSGDDRLTLCAGSFAYVPRGTVHALTVVGRRAARCLVVFNPPGAMERFYDEVRGNGVGEDVLAIAARHGIRLLTHPV